ncbi:hypothetical protein [Dyadobacter aurulentus]|uniref:hypothetical protein n=1 Tax=Dyadobacter sp. UC 10 TaxID=2605428 RepID=UPI0011F0F33F|nr:hypothetical protein [Dyadobacter sp. UC 10]KAA0988929.1 hypothetical protein FXO21_01505 [Dyadobacter sp. UC 10]
MVEPTNTPDFWFPGRWIGGTSMIIGPLLLLTAQILIVEFDFFFPQQLTAYHAHPTRLATAYNLFLAGNILLWPAVLTVARYIGQKKPMLGLWAGTLVMLGLFARTFHYGINHLAFQLVDVQNLEVATKAVADSYGAFHIVSVLSAAIMLGWIMLAFGAYRSGLLNLVHSICLGLMSALMLGVLKGASPVSVLCTAGLCVAFIPLGIRVLSDGPKPDSRNIILWPLAILGTAALMYFFGQAG